MKRAVRAWLAALSLTALPWLTLPAQAAPSTVTAYSEVAPMSDAQFWAIIEVTTPYRADADAQAEALRQTLTALAPAEVLAFRDAFERQMQRAYRWDLWAVTHIAHGGASDDGFDYFRRWLISRGQPTFERILSEPDSLPDSLSGDNEGVLEAEAFGAVATEVWIERSGRTAEEMPPPKSAALPGDAPVGEPFSEDPARLAARFPKTWARFGAAPLG
ncbi:MAG: DUF4240 domain-containing protein [Brevundimonas sp.]|nr:MAG: DUF4240 domain-containing protein [Brevundimonas sp.]